MRHFIRSLFYSCVLIAGTASAAPVVTFEELAVVAEVTPGATAAFFGLVAEPRPYSPATTEYVEMLVDSDSDGIVRFTLDEARPIGVWMVVDMSNGEHAVASPDGFLATRTSRPASSVVHKDTNVIAHVQQDEPTVVCWVVRPGVGAWRNVVQDGTDADADGLSDDSVGSALPSMLAIGDSPAAPDDFVSGDIVVTVALDSFAVTDGRLD
jgi:hypothetical protein